MILFFMDVDEMTFYEILMEELPFEGHRMTDHVLVLNGCDWICGLLNRCWQSDPMARPPFHEILYLLDTKLSDAHIQRMFISKDVVV